MMKYIQPIALIALSLVVLPLVDLAQSSAVAMDNKIVQKNAPNLTRARAMIKAKSWKLAVAELKRLEKKGPNADVYNLLGFSLRKQGQFDESYEYYSKALKLNPEHLSAHEYLGELYIQKGDLAKAKQQAAILARLCPSGCEEREDLDEALAEALKK